MESLEKHNEPPKSNTKIFLLAMLAGAIIIASIIGIIALKPSRVTIEQEALENALRAGSPGFAELSRRVIVQSARDSIMESPTALGSIMMSIPAVIQNRTDKTLTTLEVKVGVVDTTGKIIKEKTMLVVPKQQTTLAPGEKMLVTGVVEGFEKTDDRANVQWKVSALKAE